MKIILLQDVPKVGLKYEVKNVSDGFAQNFLLNRRLAELATPKTLKNLENRKKLIKEEKENQDKLLIKNLTKIEKGIILIIKEKANKKGNLFSGIDEERIIFELKNQHQIELSPEHLILEKPVKTVGEQVVAIKVGDHQSSLKLLVEKE